MKYLLIQNILGVKVKIVQSPLHHSGLSQDAHHLRECPQVSSLSLGAGESLALYPKRTQMIKKAAIKSDLRVKMSPFLCCITYGNESFFHFAQRVVEDEDVL